MLKILAISGGSLVGQNLLEALAGRRNLLELVGTNSHPDEPCLYEYDRVYLTPPTLAEPEAFSARLQRILEIEQPDLIIPCRDDDVVWLAGMGERQPEWAPRLLCGSQSAARIMQDKELSWRFALKWQLPFVPSFAASACVPDLPAELTFPLLAKPRAGFASRGIFLLSRPEQLAAVTALPDYIIQPWIGSGETLEAFYHQLSLFGLPLFHSFEGPKYAIQMLLGPAGMLTEPFCSLHLMVAGVSRHLEAIADPELRRIGRDCGRAFAQAGWRGPLNIQCLQDTKGIFWIHEFSGRLTGATAARWHLGYDEIGHCVESLLGQPFESLPPIAERIERQLICRPMLQDRRTELERSGEWKLSSEQ